MPQRRDPSISEDYNSEVRTLGEEVFATHDAVDLQC